MAENSEYPVLAKNDKDLLEELFLLLTASTKGNAYRKDGAFAAEISRLPKGLRAMAATHWLDISLALDDIGWHFFNFGEPNLVRETEDGLSELGLEDVAGWFHEAHSILGQFLGNVATGELEVPKSDTETALAVYHNWLKSSGNEERLDQLSQLAWDKDKESSKDARSSFIYESWIKYARLKPQNVFTVRKPN